jgi:ABC-2 type transport system permease protein
MIERLHRNAGRSIFGRALADRRRSMIGWVLSLVLFSAVMLAVYPTIHGNDQITKLLDSYPEALRKIFDTSNYTTGPGYLRAEVFSFVAPLLLGIFSIIWGADLIAGEEDRKTIDILLANPISRRRVLFEKWAALLAGTGLLATALLASLGFGGLLAGLHVGFIPLFAECLASGFLAAAFGSLALGVGAATGSRGLGLGVAAGVLVASYLLSTLPALVTWLTPVRPASLWYHALGVDPLTSGLEFWHLTIVMITAVAFASLGSIAFERRDLAT